MIRVGLVGARGYVGRELMAVLDADARFELVFASSRQMAGRPLSELPGPQRLERFGGVIAEDLGPEEIAAREADVYVLGLPNGLAGPFVEALDHRRPDALIIDLGADYRHREGWVYGSPELRGEEIRSARRIANPGCYATAANLALAPLADRASGPVSVFGISGFSGAGTTPGPKNDPERLEGNVMPYGFGGHGHEREIEGATGARVVFAPHVAPFFRGLIVTITMPLAAPMTASEARGIVDGAYKDAGQVRVQDAPPEVRDVAARDHCVIGGFAVSRDKPVLTCSSALDNLRKGAATQAIENIRLALACE